MKSSRSGSPWRELDIPRQVLRALVFLSLFVTLGLSADSSMAQTAHVVGQWETLPDLMPINPIHLGLLHTGKVLISAGSGNDLSDFDEHVFQAAVWNPQSGTIMLQDLEYDLFCNGMAFLPDGRTLSIGGTDEYDPFHGDSRASIFDPATEKFIQVQSMQHGRWYATATALSDGQVLTFSGIDESGNFNSAVETYKAAFGWSPESTAPWTPPLYPWLHLLPNGKVFYSGATPDSHIFDPAVSADPVTHGWTLNVASTLYGRVRIYGSSVLLPLLPPNYAPRVMILGGSDVLNNPSAPATDTTEIIDLSQPTPTWQLGPPMSAPRIQMNAVLLPNGKLLALGGSEFNEDTATASHSADLFDPATEPMTVAPAGVATFDRFYHSMALLLPNATVAVVGSNPGRGVYEKNIEIYSPPYLFNPDDSVAVRPTINGIKVNGVESSIIGYGMTFDVQVDNPADIVAGGLVALMRPGSPTHGFDMEQRMVGLSFALGLAPGTITVTGPPSTSLDGANIAPPGYYMLFVLNSAGTPSVAKFVQLSLIPANQPPKGTIISPANDVTIHVGHSVTFAGTGTDPEDGTPTRFSWVFPDATPDSSDLPNPDAVTFPTPGTYVVSLTVADSAGANDPSPPTRTITVVNPVPVTLHIDRTGAGSGTVTSNPSGINCPADCDEDYLPGALVTLTAVADPGSVFTGWSGGWCSGTGTCMPTLNSNTTVTANFVWQFTLTVIKAGTGSGTVAGTGISCGGDCSEVYNSGTVVTLTATPTSGSSFSGWSGGGCSGTGTCMVTMNADTTVTATFVASLALATSPLPDAEVGVSYSTPLVNGGAPLYAFSFLKGSSPPGLSPDSTHGTLQGTPMTSKGGSFTVQVNYPSGSPVTGSFKITVFKALGIFTKSLKAGTQGKAYKGGFQASGGKAPYSWSVVAGSLPTGLTLNSSTGAITGTPTTPGTYNFTVQVTDPIKVTDSLSAPVQKSFTLTIK